MDSASVAGMLTKSGLVRELVNNTGLSEKESIDIVDTLVSRIESQLAAGGEVQIHGFGKFYVASRKMNGHSFGHANRKRNIQQVVRFRSGARLSRLLRKEDNGQE